MSANNGADKEKFTSFDRGGFLPILNIQHLSLTYHMVYGMRMPFGLLWEIFGRKK